MIINIDYNVRYEIKSNIDIYQRFVRNAQLKLNNISLVLYGNVG